MLHRRLSKFPNRKIATKFSLPHPKKTKSTNCPESLTAPPKVENTPHQSAGDELVCVQSSKRTSNLSTPITSRIGLTNQIIVTNTKSPRRGQKKPVLYEIHVQYRLNNSPGNDLLFHKVTLEVSSALEDLTAVFGMSTGVSPPPLSPEDKLIRF